MAEREIGVVFQSRYDGNIAAHLELEKKRFLDFQSWINAHPLHLAFKVDLNGIKAQAAQIHQAMAAELGKNQGASILGPDGRSAAASVKELSKAKGLLQEISTMTYGLDKNGNLVQTGEQLKQIEQLRNGMERISKFKKNDAGDGQVMSTADKDIGNIKQLEDRLRGLNKELGKEFAGARGRGDKDGQLAALRKQKEEVDRIVNDAAKGGLVGSKSYSKAESQQDRLASRIAGMEGSLVSDSEKKAHAARTTAINKAIKAEEARATAALKANKIEMDQAERLLPNRAKYEEKINQLYQARRQILENSKASFQNMDRQLLSENRPDLANKAFNRGLNAQSQIAQANLDQSRSTTDSMRRGKKEEAAALRMATESAFKQELQDIKAHGQRRINEINRIEKEELAHAKNAASKRHIQSSAAEKRQNAYGGMIADYQGAEKRMRSAGLTSLADSTRGKASDVRTAATKDTHAFEQATRKSGHALDFHSNSLIRNVGSFMKWQIALSAIMAPLHALRVGMRNAIRVDRQFATLQTVFSGTADEARKLKNETLDLAVAQGRSANEAMDSSIRWSRLGMTRLQVLEATRVSLVASNVAEISAADAAEKLSGIYATYKLSVGDLGDVLNRLNSISNNYNVTVKDLFEGIARVSGVAKQSGLELRDLEGIIGAVTGATGRPGQEIGNALKMVITRLADPKIGESLKKAFDIDLNGPNGDLKDMSQILRELSDVYPTLNKSEQQRFLQLTAGSRQASRMAQIMTEYRQAQILTAQAAMDHGASERENEKILASLQSRIDSTKASWTDFILALGDAGGFEFISNRLRGLQGVLKDFADSADEAGKKNKKISINDVQLAEQVENLGGGWDTVAGTSSKFNEEEVMRTVIRINNAIKERQKLIADNNNNTSNVKQTYGDYKKDFLTNKTGKISDQPLTVHQEGTAKYETFSTLADAEEVRKKLLATLKSGGDTGVASSIKEATKEVSNLRDEVEGLGRFGWAFDSLGKGVASGSTDRKTMVREFQTLANALQSLPGGQKLYNDSVKEFNELLNAGDTGKIGDMLTRLAKLFQNARDPKAALLDQKVKEKTSELDGEVAALEARKAKAMESPSSESRDNEISTINTSLKEYRDAITKTNAAVEDLDKKQESAFGTIGERRLSNYVSDVLAAAKAFGEAFKDFTPDSENDPVDRIIQRHKRTLELGQEALTNIQKETNAESQTNRQNAYQISNPDERKRMLEQQDEADERTKSLIDDEGAKLTQLSRELEYEQAILAVKRTQSDASKQASTSSAAWRFGETESDKDANQAKFAIARGKAGINQAGADWLLGNDTTQTRAQAAGQVLQDEATARTALESMQRRNYDIDAARRQIAFDLTQASKDQTNEASKQLQLASRGEQLQAAAIARTVRDKGRVSADEFSMLSQNTRQNIVNYNPNQAPGNLNEARANADKSRRELDEEQTRLRKSILEVGAALKSFAADVTNATAKGKVLDPLQNAIPVGSLQNSTRDQNPTVNLSLSAINIQMKLADGLAAIVEASLIPQVRNELAAMEARLKNQKIPNPQGVTE